MSLPQEKLYTIEDIHNLPETVRAELIDGQIDYMAPPGWTHQRISLSLSRTIADYIDRKKGKCEVVPAPFGVYLDNDLFEPDITVVCDPSKLDEKGCHGAPDWIIEIVSPDNPMRDYVIKLHKYQAAGVREYWIVDPRTKTVTVYNFENQVFAVRYTFADTIRPDIYDDFAIDFSKFNF